MLLNFSCKIIVDNLITSNVTVSSKCLLWLHSVSCKLFMVNFFFFYLYKTYTKDATRVVGFIVLIKKYDWMIHENLCIDQFRLDSVVLENYARM